ALRRILDDLGGVVRWGGDYSGRKDEMHFEINANAARVAQVARSLASLVSNPIAGGGTVTSPTLPGGIPAAPAKDWFTMASLDDLTKALKGVIDTSEYRTMISNVVWKWTRFTVPGT